MSTNYNHHIYNWLEKIESNIKAFKERTDATNEEKVEFITHQYHLVMIIHRVLSGHVIFVGAKPIEEVIEPEVEPGQTSVHGHNLSPQTGTERHERPD